MYSPPPPKLVSVPFFLSFPLHHTHQLPKPNSLLAPQPPTPAVRRLVPSLFFLSRAGPAQIDLPALPPPPSFAGIPF